jgi:hypothetical protein
MDYSKGNSQDKNRSTGSLLANRAIRARLRERDIRGRDIGETDSRETVIRESIASCRIAKQLLLLTEIRDDCG